jgi:hypothetical protein
MQQIIIHKNRTITLPQNINECSQLQVIAITALLQVKVKAITGLLFALRILSGLNWWGWLTLKAQHKEALLQHIKWIYNDELQLTNQFMPKYRGFYGCKTELDNLTLAEFYATEKYYTMYQAGDDTALDLLCAVLYRPGKPFYNKTKDIDGDCRKKYNANLTPYYAGIISRWPLAVKQSIAFFYDGCQRQLVANNPKLFTKNSGGEASDGDLFVLIRGLAGGKYGTFEQVEGMYLHTAMYEMNCLIEEREKAEAELKKV